MAKGDDIQERLIQYSVRVMRVSDSLPRTRAGRHVSDQLLRCGTSPAAQYAEARGAESTNDFIHKLRICLKELNESFVWLRTILLSGMLPADKLAPLLAETAELSRIVNASISTAQARRISEATETYDPDP